MFNTPFTFLKAAGGGADPDATAYLAAVVAAGGTVDATITSATNTLFTDLKSAGIYTNIKVMYPMVGGTTGSVAVEGKQPVTRNITWIGDITADSSGVVPPSGGTGYGDIPLNPSVDYSGYVNSNHIAYYSLTSAGSGGYFTWDIGVGNANTGVPLYGLILRRAVNQDFDYDAGDYPDGRLATTSSNASGFILGTATSASSKKLFRNGSLVLSDTATATGSDFNANFWLFRINSVPATTIEYAKHKCAFLSLGLGLNDTQAGDFQTIVNAFQTALGRNTY